MCERVPIPHRQWCGRLRDAQPPTQNFGDRTGCLVHLVIGHQQRPLAAYTSRTPTSGAPQSQEIRRFDPTRPCHHGRPECVLGILLPWRDHTSSSTNPSPSPVHRPGVSSFMRRTLHLLIRGRHSCELVFSIVMTA